jgi:hypothetical protein
MSTKANPGNSEASQGVLAITVATIALMGFTALAQIGTATNLQGDMVTNSWRWIDRTQEVALIKDFDAVRAALEEANALTNNAAVDAKLDEAKAGIKRIAQQEVPSVRTNALELLRQYRGEMDGLRAKINEPGLSAEWVEKYRALVSDWQAVTGTLELKIEEVKALEQDLGGFIKSSDEQRQYWRARMRLHRAEALNTAIAAWLKDLRDLKGRLATTLEPEKESPRPQIGSSN